MFQDMGSSRALNAKFKDTALAQSLGGSSIFSFISSRTHPPLVDFQVQVLSSGSWPFTSGSAFKCPADLERGLDRFKTFYDVSTFESAVVGS